MSLDSLDKLTSERRFRVRIIDNETCERHRLEPDITYNASVKLWRAEYGDPGPRVLRVYTGLNQMDQEDYSEVPFTSLDDFNKKFSIENNSLSGGRRRQKRTRRNRKSKRKSRRHR